MKRFFLLLISIAIAYSAFAQPTVVASEEWGAILDNDSANHGQQTFVKYSDGSITTNGTWYYVYQGSTIQSPFSDGTTIIADTVFSFIAQGTATNPNAPIGYQSSTFILNVIGSARNGKSSGTWSNTFSTYGWPPILLGTYTATRKSGSGITVSVKEITSKTIPKAFTLVQNFPNPFNPSTTIQYGLPARSTVHLVIYNILGQAVTDLVNTEQSAGWNQVVWNANAASGLYFYQLEAASLDNPSKRFVETRKMLLLR